MAPGSYLERIAATVADGLTPVASYWSSSDLYWLDGGFAAGFHPRATLLA